ncbi:hypothetical protein BDZ97DRAFT_1755019 [Flammula alnicola]|nr:hypothetical protein BDZ97DRAFT_1755019 [Flammula alnicola]
MPKSALSAYFSQDWRERIKPKNPDAGFVPKRVLAIHVQLRLVGEDVLADFEQDEAVEGGVSRWGGGFTGEGGCGDGAGSSYAGGSSLRLGPNGAVVVEVAGTSTGKRSLEYGKRIITWYMGWLPCTDLGGLQVGKLGFVGLVDDLAEEQGGYGGFGSDQKVAEGDVGDEGFLNKERGIGWVFGERVAAGVAAGELTLDEPRDCCTPPRHMNYPLAP